VNENNRKTLLVNEMKMKIITTLSGIRQNLTSIQDLCFITPKILILKKCTEVFP